MKMIVAIIRPERVKNVKDALKAAGINGLTLFPVKGRGAQSGVCFTTRTGTFCVDEIEKMMLNIAVDDDQKQLAVDTIKEHASTGHIGDGRIFILPLEESIKVSDL
ncbi:MAG: P-II family nitrogen regulator [Candidatus Methanoplasma sp.]|jgi:nitrogen regulatory protein P-II 1|nr:P-II family nitrogen regulator [Candidatus Methanoplasma sp.]